MKNEILFSYYATWHDRYEDKGARIVISADFDDPTVWPYTVRKYEVDEESFDFPKPQYEVASARLSPALYAKLKAVIAGHPELKDVPKHIENTVRDGQMEEFLFACDDFSCPVGGMSVLGFGSDEVSLPEDERTGNYTVYAVYCALEETLRKEGIELL